VVEAVEPPNRFSFRWNHPAGEQPTTTNSMLVEFTLVGEGERTRLRVVETGHELHAWPESEKTATPTNIARAGAPSPIGW
jgi:uncharacterized protein YndB with AHSA1/START domain